MPLGVPGGPDPLTSALDQPKPEARFRGQKLRRKRSIYKCPGQSVLLVTYRNATFTVEAVLLVWIGMGLWVALGCFAPAKTQDGDVDMP